MYTKQTHILAILELLSVLYTENTVYGKKNKFIVKLYTDSDRIHGTYRSTILIMQKYSIKIKGYLNIHEEQTYFKAEIASKRIITSERYKLWKKMFS